MPKIYKNSETVIAKPTSHSQQLFTYEIYYLYHISIQY